MPQWHYLRATPHCAITAQILDHMRKRGCSDEFVAAAFYQSVIYFALADGRGRVSAVICPLDRSGEFGRFTTGYCAFDENALPESYPASWARCPDQIIASLTPAASLGAKTWRERCVTYRNAMSRLGRISKGAVVRLQRPVEVDGVRCRLLQCEDARKNLYAVLDSEGISPIHLSRDAIAESGGALVSTEAALEILESGFDQMQLFARRKSG